MNNLFVVLSITTLFYLADSSKVSFIKKCEWNDDECHKESANAAIPIMTKGIPELGMASVEPLFLDNIDASTPVLVFKISNINVHGAKDCQALNIRRDKEHSKLYVKILCNTDLNADYELKGQMLIGLLQGHGKMVCKLRGLVISAEIDIAEVNISGENHWTIKSWTHTFELQEKGFLELDNLVPSSKGVENALKDLLANKVNDIVVEIGPPIVKAILTKCLTEVEHLFHAVPISDLVLS